MLGNAPLIRGVDFTPMIARMIGMLKLHACNSVEQATEKCTGGDLAAVQQGMRYSCQVWLCSTDLRAERKPWQISPDLTP